MSRDAAGLRIMYLDCALRPYLISLDVEEADHVSEARGARCGNLLYVVRRDMDGGPKE